MSVACAIVSLVHHELTHFAQSGLYPAGIVNACFRNCWYVANLGHWVANPVLVLEGLDLSLD